LSLKWYPESNSLPKSVPESQRPSISCAKETNLMFLILTATLIKKMPSLTTNSSLSSLMIRPNAKSKPSRLSSFLAPAVNPSSHHRASCLPMLSTKSSRKTQTFQTKRSKDSSKTSKLPIKSGFVNFVLITMPFQNHTFPLRPKTLAS
jgi:hypothetical protein